MSWSVNYIGKPEKIAEALDKHSESLSGQCKAEFDSALPHVKALVLSNYNDTGDCGIQLSANGHGWAGNSSCNVEIKPLGSALV